MHCADEKNSRAFLLSAVAAPVVQLAAGSSWVVAAATGAACTILSILPGTGTKGKLLSAVQWLWLIPVLSWSVNGARYCWQQTEDSLILPGTLLLLAAWTAAKGKTVSARAGNLLRFFLIALLAVVLLSGIGEIRLSNLRPQWRPGGLELAVLFLLPALFQAAEGEKIPLGTKTAAMVLGVGAAAVGTGVLSLGYAGAAANPLCELSRSIKLLGTSYRFESLASWASTLGWYLLLTCILTAAGSFGKACLPGKEKCAVWVCAAVSFALSLTGTEIKTSVLIMGSVLLWVAIPAVAALWTRKNQVKNREN